MVREGEGVREGGDSFIVGIFPVGGKGVMSHHCGLGLEKRLFDNR